MYIFTVILFCAYFFKQLGTFIIISKIKSKKYRLHGAILISIQLVFSGGISAEENQKLDALRFSHEKEELKLIEEPIGGPIKGEGVIKLSAGDSNKPRIKFKNKIEVSQQAQYRLLDLVEIESPTQDLLKQLWKIEIPAKLTQLPVFKLTHQEQLGFARQLAVPKEFYQLIITDSQTIIKSAEILSAQHLSRILGSIASTECINCEIEIKFHALPKVLLTDWTWDPLDRSAPRGSFTISLTHGAGSYKEAPHYWLTGVAKWKKSVPVLKRKITFSERILEEDVMELERDITLVKDVIEDSKKIYSQKSAKTLFPFVPLSYSDLEKENMVIKNRNVRAVLGDGGFEITFETTAEESGYLGDVIKIKSLEGKKIISGKVIGRNLVKVE